MIDHDHSKCEPNDVTKAAMLEAQGINDYEVFIIDKNNNNILSLDKDQVYFFNKTNFDTDDFEALKNNNIEYLINKGLALRLDSQIIYRMYLGFINKPVCVECKRRIGHDENNKGFGNLTA
jgi:hypothetical protein